MTIGSLIGPYRIVEKIGAGGMGQVFLAEHTLLGRRAAVKTLLPALSAHHEIIERFFNEARATSAITDPGVVQIFDFGYHVDGTAYIVMELLEGESLADRIERMGTLPLEDALRIVRQCAGSIGAAHAQGIVHRDLKPENIFLVRDPEASGGERPKILDFGICKLATSDAMTTQTGTMFGTPAYMSPEQCRGAGAIDQRSDIYAFGCLLFHMLTGRPPFWKDAPGELLVAHMHEEPPRPSDFVPSIPPEVDALALRCLAKDPADRFASMADLQATVAALELDMAIDAAPDAVDDDDSVRPTPVSRTARRMSVATPRPTPPPRFSTGGGREGSGPHRAGAPRSALHRAVAHRDGSGPHRDGGHRDGSGPHRDGARREGSALHRPGSGPHRDGSRRDGSGPHRDGSGPHRDGVRREGLGLHRDAARREGSGLHRDAARRDGSGPHRDGSELHRPGSGPQRAADHDDAALELPARREDDDAAVPAASPGLPDGVLARARWNDSGDHPVPPGRWTEPQDDDIVPPRRRFRGIKALFLSVMVIAEIAAVIAIVLARSEHHQHDAWPEPVATDPVLPAAADPNAPLLPGDTTGPAAAEVDRAIAGTTGSDSATGSASEPVAPPAADKVAVDQPAADKAAADKAAAEQAAADKAAADKERRVEKTVRPTARHAVAKKQQPAPRQHQAPAPIVIEQKPASPPPPPTTEELYETR